MGEGPGVRAEGDQAEAISSFLSPDMIRQPMTFSAISRITMTFIALFSLV
jgi:hypothetical protein